MNPVMNDPFKQQQQQQPPLTIIVRLYLLKCDNSQRASQQLLHITRNNININVIEMRHHYEIELNRVASRTFTFPHFVVRRCRSIIVKLIILLVGVDWNV